MIGCSEPVTEIVAEQPQETNSNALAAQAVHHPRRTIKPVLAWRHDPSPTVPMALTASDGTGLDLVSMKARVIIEDPLAFTELHLTFDNPENRRREGRFEIELPPGAALSRLAMKIQGHFQEGEVVERQRARRTFEGFMHERPNVDPALLENDTANRVRARVFPILPRERKEIMVSFSQELGSAPYRLPLQGLSTVEDFDVRVVVKTHDPTQDHSSLSGMQSAQRVVELRRTRFTPDKDLVVELDGAGPAAGLHAGDLAVVRVRPDAERPATRPDSLLVLVDTSASSAAGFEDRIDRLGAVMQQLATDRDFPVRVLGFDQVQHPVFEGMASQLGVDALADLVEGRALGASDLGAALAQIARAPQASQTNGRWDRILLVSDGIATAGITERSALRAAVRELEAAGVRRLDALAPGARQDRERLADLISALPEPGVIVDDGSAPDVIASALTQAPFGDVALTVPGASWSWPASLEGIGPGQDVLVFAHYEGTRPSAMRVEFSDPSLPAQEIETLEVERPLVERAWARTRIARLQHQLARLPAGPSPSRAAMLARVVALSTHYRVLTDLTALLVLETEADYRRYGISRRGKADILTVDGGSVRVHRRSDRAPVPIPVEDDLAGTQLAAVDPDANDAIPQMAREFDPETAADNEGILELIQSESGHFLASPLGAAFAVGNDDEDVWGGPSEGTIGLGNTGLIGKGGGGGTGTGYGAPSDDAVWGSLHGTEVGEAFGVGGLGLVGTGRGGGGTGEGMIGLGNTGVGLGSTGVDPGVTGLLGPMGTVTGTGTGTDSGMGSGYGRGSGAGFGGRGRRVPRVRQAKAQVMGALDRDIVRRIVRAHINEVRHCYNQGLSRDPNLRGRVLLVFSIDPSGRVLESQVEESSSLPSDPVKSCIAKAVRRWRFPTPTGGGTVQVKMPFVMDHGGSSAWSSPSMGRTPRRTVRRRRPRPVRAAHTGRFAEVQRLLAANEVDAAYDLAWSWVQTQPDDVLGLLALGDSLERRHRPTLAARVYGSLIDLHPSRADIRRAAGQRLERLGDPGLVLAIDTYAKAVASRPDHPSGARLHAWALVKQGDHRAAFDVLDAALRRRYPAGRFAGVKTLMRQDLSLVAAAWLAKHSGDALVQAQAHVRAAGVRPDTEASTRFVVTWETDTTDVDVLLHTVGSRRSLHSRHNHGRRIADVRTGYGPEARVLRGEQIPPALHASVRYFDRSSQGHAMGTVHVVAHDGRGHLSIQARPFVLMQQRGVLDLGSIATGVDLDAA
ncbi:MAG: TonB family protein [Myxococcota bacterium]